MPGLRIEFGRTIRRLRDERGWSVRKLAEVSGIPFPNISLAERGHLPLGPTTAGRLAAAFDLHDVDRQAFLHQAAACAKYGRLSADNYEYPVSIVNILPDAMRVAGVDPDAMRGCLARAEIVPETGHDDAVMHILPPARSAIIKPAVKKFLEQHQDRKTLAIIFLEDGRQVVVQSDVTVF